MAEEYVHVGNLVTFESESGDLLSVDVCGVITWVAAPRNVPSGFDQCIWRICDKLSYSEQSFLANLNKQSPSTLDIDALKRHARREQMRNEAELANPSGKEVRYGSIVQIQHVATGKFLSASNTPAKLSRECLDVYLDEGSEAVYFKLRPRYKVRSSGGILLEHDVILLSSQISPGFCLHESIINKNDIAPISHNLSKIEESAGEPPAGEVVRETNLSKNASACGITINVYEIPCPKLDDIFLRVRQHIRLFDRDNNGFIVAPSCPKDQIDKSDGVECQMPHVKALISNDRDPSHPDEFASNQLWSFEHAPPGKRRLGGFVEWNKPLYRVKHIASGCYLTAGTKVEKAARSFRSIDRNRSGRGHARHSNIFNMQDQVDENEDECHLELTLEKSAADLGLLSRQLFSFQMVDSKQEYIPKTDAFIGLCHTTAKGAVYYVHTHIGYVNKAIKLSSVSHPYDAIMLVDVTSEETKAVHFAKSVVPPLNKYLDSLKDPNSIYFPQHDGDVEVINNVLTRIICEASLGMNEEYEFQLENPEAISLFQERSTPLKLSQDCARELGILEILLKIVVAPANAGLKLGYGKISSDGSNSARSSVPGSARSFTNRVKKIKNGWEDKNFGVIALTHQLAWAAIRQLVFNNNASIWHFALLKTEYQTLNPHAAKQHPLPEVESMGILLEQVPYPVGAADLLTCLVDDDKELLLRVVDERTISYFKTMISNFGPQARFLQFYEACVSCQGEPLHKNQNLVARELISGVKSQRDSILLTLYTIPGLEYPSVSNVQIDEDYHNAFLGQEYFHGNPCKGFPRVFVSWEYSKNWKVGSSSLYYTPQQLGLREVDNFPTNFTTAPEYATRHQKHIHRLRELPNHVSIEELCWILDKEECFHKVREDQGPWNEEAALKFDSRITVDKEGHSMLANYLHAQIELFAEMVYGRNYSVMAILEDMFPYIMCVGLISLTCLPYKLRSSFVKLTKRLWVDRYPCEPNCGRRCLPDLVWPISNVHDISIYDHNAFPSFYIHPKNPLRKRRNPVYHISGSNKFKLLLDFVDRFVNEFQRLVHAKVYQNQCVSAVMELVSMLASFGFYASTESLAKMVAAVLPMLDGRSDVMCDDDSLSSYILSSSESSVVHHVLRYQLDSESKIIMNAKIGILNCVDAMISMRQQFRLQRLLYCFKQWLKHSSNHGHGHGRSKESQYVEVILSDIPKIFDVNNPDMNALVIDTLSVIPFKGTLVDLLMYESDELFENVLASLEYNCIPMKSLLEVSQKVLVLKNDSIPVFGDLSIFECRVSEIKQHFESVQEWGRKLSNDNTQDCFDSVWSILDSMREYMNPDTLSAENKEDTIALRQEMFYDFDVHNILMLPLTWPISALDQSSQNLSTPEDRKRPNSLFEIAKFCLELIHAIIVGNRSMRVSFRKFKEKLCKKSVLHLFDSQVYPLLTEAYKGNREEVLNTPASLFALFGGVLSDLSSSHDYTLFSFFLNQLVPDDHVGENIPRNQSLVAIELTKILKSTARERNVFHAVSCSSNTKMRDHIRAIEVLGHCCEGNRELMVSLGCVTVTSNEARDRVFGILGDLDLAFAIFDDDSDTFHYRDGVYECPAETEGAECNKFGEMTNMGLDMEPCIHRDAELTVTFLKAYLNFLSGCYFSSMAVDTAVLCEGSTIELITELSYFAKHYYLLNVDTIDVLHTKGGFNINTVILEIKEKAEELDLYSTILRCLNCYVRTVNESKDRRVQEVSREAFEYIYSASDVLFAHNETLAVDICASMGHNPIDVVAEFKMNRKARSENHGASIRSKQDDDVASHSTSRNEDFVSVAESGIGVGEEETLVEKYAMFLEDVGNSPLIQEMCTCDERTLLQALLDAQQLTDPDDEAYCSGLNKSHIAENVNGTAKYLQLEDEVKIISEKLALDSIGDAKINPEKHSVYEGTSDVEIRTNKVTWEDIVKRMIRYVNHQVDIDGPHKSTCTILRIFITYIKDLKYETEGEKAGVCTHLYGDKRARQLLLNGLQVTKLVYRLIVAYSKGPIFELSLELGNCLLDEGNADCQSVFISLAHSADADGEFFSNLHGVIQGTKAWVLTSQHSPLKAALYTPTPVHAESKKKNAKLVDDKNIRTCLLVIKFMQQLCEGHRLEMQNLLRDQTGINRFSSNLVFACSTFVDLMASKHELYAHISPQHRLVLIYALEFLIEACQGPCAENQELLGSHTTLSACKLLLTANANRPSTRDAVIAVKYRVINLLAAMLENATVGSPISTAMSIKIDVSTVDDVYAEFHYYLYKSELEATSKDKYSTKQIVEEDVRQENIANVTASICNILFIRKRILLKAKSHVDDLHGNEMPKCHAVCSKTLARVEVFWNGQTEEIWFPRPPEAKFLSHTTKEAFLNSCDLTSADSRKKDLMGAKNNFLDEMEVLSEFSFAFQFILRNYFTIKRIMFLIVVLLNFNIILTLVHGSSVLVDYYSSGGRSAKLMGLLGAITLVGYSAITIYWAQQTFAFNFRKLQRDRDFFRKEQATDGDVVALPDFEIFKKFGDAVTELSRLKVLQKTPDEYALRDMAMLREYNHSLEVERQSSLNKRSSIDLSPLVPLLGLIFMFLVACSIHLNALYDEKSRWSYTKFISTYVYTMIIIFAPLSLYFVRRIVVIPTRDATLYASVIIDTIVNPNVLGHFVLVVSIVAGLYGYIFMYSVVLMDFVTMSVHARNTVRSIIQPWQPLLNVGMIFLVVIEIFGIFSFVRFGGNNAIQSGIVLGDDDENVECDNAWSCLGVVFYGGLRNSDISSVLQAAEPGHTAPGEVSFTSRFFFDLLFFIIIGCLLFNMVTGIIVDTFSSLREESEEINRLQTEETFISGMTSEMLDGTGVKFEEVQENQNMWDYIFYVIYLQRKSPTSYDGLEVYVSKCIESEDTSWFPHRTCAALEQAKFDLSQEGDDENAQHLKADGNGGEDLNNEHVSRLNGLLAKMQETMERLVERQEAIDKAILSLHDRK